MPQQTQRVAISSQSDIREMERLEALDGLQVLDSPHDETFGRFARLIEKALDVPIAIVSVIDAHRQLYLACEGLTASEVERKNTFCGQTILRTHPMIVPDATKDPRFADNPHVTGEPHVRFYAGAPLLTSDGHAIGTVCAIDVEAREFSEREAGILSGIADLVVDHIELRQMATVDALTGVLSRRAFRTASDRALASANRYKHNLSIVAFDIDRFKAINDTFGHAAGDKVLADVAAACMAGVRASDMLGRIGGEEFAVLLSNTDRQGALDVAEKLRGLVAALPFEPGGEPYPITASFGVATLDIAAKDTDTLLANADAALYLAKAEGRNRVVGWRAAVQKGARRRVLKAGVIHFNGRMSTLDCTVRALSEDGAGLDISSSFGLPERFNLLIRSDGIDVPCRIVGRTDRHIEVEFV